MDPGPSTDSNADEQVTLNYAFMTPSSGDPAPLPLIVPQTLITAALALIRPIVVSNLESEGIAVQKSDIRFWMSRTPLECDVAVNSWKTWLQQAANERETPFLAIPLTRTISSCLNERLYNDELIHLFTTQGPDFNINTTSVDAAIPQTIAAQITALGAYSTPRYRHTVTEGECHSKVIQLTDSLIPPAILLGIRFLDVGTNNGEIELTSYVSDVHPDTFQVHVSTFGKTNLHGAILAWMAIRPQYPPTPRDPEPLQWRTFDSRTAHPEKVGEKVDIAARAVPASL